MAKTGRKPFAFSDKDRAEIEHLAGLCMSQDEIASIKGCDRNTLVKHCALELQRGKDRAKAMVTNALFSNIKKGKEASIFFYLKTQHGWREKQDIELTGKDGAPFVPIINITVAKK